jgi:hypothetical protein
MLKKVFCLFYKYYYNKINIYLIVNIILFNYIIENNHFIR